MVRILILLAWAGLFFSGPPMVSAQASQEQTGTGLSFTGEESEFLKANPVITVTNEFDWPPFDFVTAGQPAGFGVELMEMLARKAGLAIRFINGYTWDELTAMFFDGRIHVIHSLSITPEREKNALFSPPYYHSKNVLILRRDTRNIKDLNDLEGKIVALPKGWSSIEFLKKHFPGIHIIEVESSRQTLEYVDQGKVAATMEQEGIARYFIQKFGFTDLTLSGWIENDALQQTSSMHFAVLKTNRPLFSILNKSLKAVSPGEMAALKEKWLSRSGREIGKEDVGLTPEERQWLAAKANLSVCVFPDRLPFSHHTRDRIQGMAADILEIFQEKLGIRITPVYTPDLERARTHINTGVADVVALVSKTDDRLKYFDFTAAFMEYNVAIITRDDFPFVQGIPELPPDRTGIADTGNVRDLIRLKYPELKHIAIPTARQCLVKVSSGQLDAAVLSLPVASHYIRKLGLSNLKVAGHTRISEDFRIGVPKQDKRLHSIMSKAVRSLAPAEISAMYEKWAGPELEQATDYDLVWKTLTIASVILICVGLWNRKLARLNREIARANKKLKENQEELKRISITDSLTNVYNRRYIEDALETEIKRSARHQRSMAVILADIDFFKAINDNLGHQAGDAVLSQFAGLVKKSIRSTDTLGRWGGEEFLIICPEIDGSDAAHLARQLCRKIAGTHFITAGRQTASFGVTGFKQGDDSSALIQRADKALYRAKAMGRNRVETAT